jgi:hypothetical protein
MQGRIEGARQQAEGTTLPATTKDQTGEAPIEQPPIISHVPPAESGPTQSFGRKVVSQQTVVTPTITQSQQTVRVKEESMATRKVRRRRSRKCK